jgi:hypothetical protein
MCEICSKPHYCKLQNVQEFSVLNGLHRNSSLNSPTPARPLQAFILILATLGKPSWSEDSFENVPAEIWRVLLQALSSLGPTRLKEVNDAYHGPTVHHDTSRSYA